MLILKADELQGLAQTVTKLARKQNSDLHAIVGALVSWQQEARLSGDYAVSDRIRTILDGAGIEIVRGTAGYEYDSIPTALIGRQVNDTWRCKE